MSQNKKVDKKPVSQFKYLPADILRLLGLYLDIDDIISLCHLNKKIKDSITEKGIFLRDLGHQRLSKYSDRLQNRHVIDEIISVNTLKDAVIRGYLEKVKYFIKDSLGFYPFEYYRLLTSAVSRNYLDIVEYLLERKSNLDLYDHKHDALIIAARHGYLEIFKYLISKGYLNQAAGALQAAIEDNRLSIVEYLMSENLRSNLQRIDCLSLAAMYGHLALVKYLITKNIDTRIDDALWRAAGGGHLAIVKYLIENGADVHTRDDSALIFAIDNGYLDVTKYLVERGADIHARDNYAIKCANIRDYQMI